MIPVRPKVLVFLSSFISFGLLMGTPGDQLVILSAHSKSIQQEFVPPFEAYYKKNYGRPVEVSWLFVGGASDAHRLVLSNFERSPQGIKIDLFWGGGEQPYYDLNHRHLLAPVSLSPGTLYQEVPQNIGVIPLYNTEKTWYASAISSFGIFYNKKASSLLKMPIPETWEDLAKPIYYKNVAMADPRRSSSNVTILFIILKAYGWEKGWEILTGLAANTKKFLHSSTDPIKWVLTGNTVTGLTVGYYAQAKILELGSDKLGYVMPKGKTILNADPIARLKGAPNPLVADRFISYLLSAETQARLVLPQGHPLGGPKYSTLGRMAVNQKTYENLKPYFNFQDNPFEMASWDFRFDMDEAARLQGVFMDLYASLFIDTHTELRGAWRALGDAKEGFASRDWEEFYRLPLKEVDLKTYAAQWKDGTFRNQKITEWITFAKKKYTSFHRKL
jgi:ABC-type Fe3+ transport system substrate-binding protein